MLSIIGEFQREAVKLAKDPNSVEELKRFAYARMSFIHYSKTEIENLGSMRVNSILISIAGLNDDFAEVDDSRFKDVLRLRFSDVTRDFGKFLAFRKNQAEQIIAFVNRNIPVDFVYINCEQGRSRSAAIHSALEKIYHAKEVNFLHCNLQVKETLLDVIKNQRVSEVSTRIRP
jgi:predicted protein tyrosine phosphatase